MRTEPGSDNKQNILRVITLEGDEVIKEASELTKSQSNVMVKESMASDFTKHLLAYENRR